jgi:integrase
MPKKKGTRNLNGMGNVYFNKRTLRYEYRRMQDGEIRFASAKTPAELKDKIKEMGELSASKSKIKLYDWADQWLAMYVKPYKKISTYSQYKEIWEVFCKPYIKNIMLRSVKPYDVRCIIAKLHERDMSANTMKQARKVLNLIFKTALSEKLISENPVSDIEIPDVQQRTRKVLKLDEIKQIFEFLQTSRWYWVIRFMLVTGLRRGELLALKWSDIDYTQKVITVEDNNTYYGIGTTKSNKVHYVPLSDLAIQCLEAFKKQLENENNPALQDKDNDIIFVSQHGKPMRPNSFYNVFRYIKKNTGIDVYPHAMRHTFVYYSKNKLSLSELKDALGHDESTSTLDIYGNMLSNTKVVAEKIDDVFENVVVEEETPKQVVGGNNVIDFMSRKKQK